MSQFDYKFTYERNLPHFQPPGAALFVTCRLAGSIPQTIREQLEARSAARLRQFRLSADPDQESVWLEQEQKRRFADWDNILDQVGSGPVWLRQPEIAGIVAESLRYRDGRTYELDAFNIMPNHVHILFKPLLKADRTLPALQAIMHGIKRYTARQSNRLLGREGQFWQHESFDHVVRNEQEWTRIVRYIMNNPVKAGLVASWEEWPWTYVKSLDGLDG